MAPLLVGGAIGAVVGQRLAPHLADRRLRRGFAALLIGSALLTGAEAIKRHHMVLPLELQAETHRNPAEAKVRL